MLTVCILILVGTNELSASHREISRSAAEAGGVSLTAERTIEAESFRDGKWVKSIDGYTALTHWDAESNEVVTRTFPRGKESRFSGTLEGLNADYAFVAVSGEPGGDSLLGLRNVIVRSSIDGVFEAANYGFHMPSLLSWPRVGNALGPFIKIHNDEVPLSDLWKIKGVRFNEKESEIVLSYPSNAKDLLIKASVIFESSPPYLPKSSSYTVEAKGRKGGVKGRSDYSWERASGDTYPTKLTRIDNLSSSSGGVEDFRERSETVTSFELGSPKSAVFRLPHYGFAEPAYGRDHIRSANYLWIALAASLMLSLGLFVYKKYRVAEAG